MNQDEASQLLAEGFVYYARNYLFDKIGIARKRGGITGLGATTTYSGDLLSALTLDDGSVQLYAVTSADVSAINSSTGAFTTLGSSVPPNKSLNQNGGRAFQHYGFMVYPSYQTNSSDINVVAVAGATGSKAARTFGTPATIAVTSGDKRIVCAAGDNPTTLMQVGQIIVIKSGAGQAYIGRVTSLVSSTAFEVYPTPGITIAAAAVSNAYTANAIDPFVGGGYGAVPTANAFISSKVGMSFQGRVVLGNIGRVTIAPAVRQEIYPRRVVFSSTLLEGDTFGTGYNGAVFLTQNGYPALNYFDIPAQEAVTAMSPTGFGDALIFTAFRTYRLTGNLTTQFGTEQSVTWSPREIPNSVGCMSERSVQRTPRGVVFAHDSGIYTTDGASMQPLMHGTMENYWNNLIKSTVGAFQIYGSGLIRGNHYYICGTAGSGLWALMVNLNTLAWGVYDGKASTPASWIINSMIQDPVSPSRTWGLKWFGFSGTASMTGGQLLKVDDMFSPTSANHADSDTTVVTTDLITKPYTEDSPGIQKVWQDATIDYNLAGGSDVRVTAGFVLESADLAAAASAFTNLDSQDVYTVTAATNAAPIVVTCGAHTIKVDTWVRIVGVTGNTAANGPWRVAAVAATTITLMGSVGNGAYVSGGTVRVVDQRDVSLLAQARATQTTGQNYDAVAYRVQDVGGSDSFELLSITHNWDDRGGTSE